MLFDTVVISAVEGVAGAEDTLADVLYETVSAFATVGLTTGITPTLSVVSKLLISLTMFLGRGRAADGVHGFVRRTAEAGRHPGIPRNG